MKTPIVLGIDGGGTKTLAVAMEASGGVPPDAPRGAAGPSNIASLDADDAADAVIAAATAALQAGGWQACEVGGVCVGIAGYSHQANRRRLLDRIRGSFPDALYDIQADYVTAFDGALAGGPGVVVIAGTGQVAYGEDGRSGTARAGGYGYLIDDQGSGYSVGRCAIAAVLRAWDEGGPATSLTETLARVLDVHNTQEVIEGVYGGSIDRVRIASLAKLVSGDADQGDDVAVTLLHDAGRDLAGLASSVASRLWSLGEPFEVAVVGSLWNSDIVYGQFARTLKEIRPNSILVEPRFDPAAGAALRSVRLLDRERKGQ